MYERLDAVKAYKIKAFATETAKERRKRLDAVKAYELDLCNH